MVTVKTLLTSKITWFLVLGTSVYLVTLNYKLELGQYIQSAFRGSLNEPFYDNKTSTNPGMILVNGSYQFRFRGVYNDTEYLGEPFDSKWNEILKKLRLFPITKINDDVVLKSTPKIVTGFSDNHFGEAVRLVTKIHEVYGDEKILYVFDIGLNENNKKSFANQFNKTIIEMRKFRFENFPPYVGNLFEYRWKPLIIAEMLTELKSFWWMDTSIQMKGPIKTLYSDISNCSTVPSCPYYPWIMPDEAGHSIFSTTDKRMVKYFPYPDEPLMKSLMMYGANLMLIYGTNNVKEDIVRLWVLCALQPDCMAPSGTTIYCNFAPNDRWNIFANCHRYDQSAINLLLAWENNFNPKRYTHHSDNAFVLY